MRIFRVFLTLTSLFLAGCATARPVLSPPVPFDPFLSDTALRARVLALDPEKISAEDVSEVLSKCPAPPLLAFNGSALDTMGPFAAFLKKMGYPDVEVYPSWGDASRFARGLEASPSPLRPMLIGHSQGGAFVIKVLHALKGKSVSFAAAVATGKLMRVVLGQWDTLPILLKVPDSTEEFAGYRLAGDLIAAGAGEYEATGAAKVRNVLLEGPGHLNITDLEGYAKDPAARAWIDSWTPGTPAPGDGRLLFAADIWYHVKKHWCLELQTLADGG